MSNKRKVTKSKGTGNTMPGSVGIKSPPKVFTVTPSIDEYALFSHLGKGEEYRKLERAHAKYTSEVEPGKKAKALRRFTKLRDELYAILEANEIPHDKMPPGFKKNNPVNYELTSKVILDLIEKEASELKASGRVEDWTGTEQHKQAVLSISGKLDKLIMYHGMEEEPEKKKALAYHIEKAREYLQDAIDVNVTYKTHMPLKERLLLNRHSVRTRRTKEENDGDV